MQIEKEKHILKGYVLCGKKNKTNKLTTNY